MPVPAARCARRGLLPDFTPVERPQEDSAGGQTRRLGFNRYSGPTFFGCPVFRWGCGAEAAGQEAELPRRVQRHGAALGEPGASGARAAVGGTAGPLRSAASCPAPFRAPLAAVARLSARLGGIGTGTGGASRPPRLAPATAAPSGPAPADSETNRAR